MDISEKFVDFRYGGRFSRAWLQSPQANTMLVTKALPHEVAFLAFVPLYVPAGPSAHAPAASLSVQKTSAIPAEVAASAPINKCASINP